MNFFERQHVARRNSRLLALLFTLAVVAIVYALDFIGSNAWVVARLYFSHRVPGHVPGTIHAAIVGVTLAAILGVSVAKMLELRAGGGAAVAWMMGGRGIGRGTGDPLERRLLNVVDEMAIASGIRVPLVFVMDSQKGINAFTAGQDVSHSAVVVTRGALESLTRDELQGIVGHEFSHIMNGDTALNIRMIGVLAGIVWIGAAGRFVMRGCAEAKDVRVLPVAALGFLVFLVGSIGLLASRIIKALLSREREYLADAGGVQFTRNAEGLAGALDQIRSRYSWVSHLHTEDVSHLFFADADGFLSEPLFSTHPPIDKRIARIAPDFAPADYRRRREAAVESQAAEAATPRRPRPSEATWSFSAAQALALVGSVEAEHVAEARRALDSLPQELHEAVDDPRRAPGVVVALLLARDEAMEAQAALAALGTAGFPTLVKAAADMQPLVASITVERHLAVVDLALPALRSLRESDRDELVRALQAILATDRRVSLYGFAFVTFVRSQLETSGPIAPARYRSLAQLRDEAAVVISLVAYAGCADAATVDRDFVRAFEAGAVESGLVGQIAARRRDDCAPDALSQALMGLRELAPLDKARLVKGLFAAITADGVIRTIESALMRMIGGVLDCPLPPLVSVAAASSIEAAPTAMPQTTAA